MAKVYGYYINLDERGEFAADVRDLNDQTVWEVDTESACELIEDGFVSDIRDADKIESHLRDSGIIEKDTHIYPMAQFEKIQERYLRDPEGLEEDEGYAP